ncbi:hypothetical protein D3C71_1065240 [compost metagenome]
MFTGFVKSNRCTELTLPFLYCKYSLCSRFLTAPAVTDEISIGSETILAFLYETISTANLP